LEGGISIGLGIIQHSHAWHAKQLYVLGRQGDVQAMFAASLPEMGAAKAMYAALFQHVHPVGSVHDLLVTKYGQRWCLASVLNSNEAERVARVAVGNLRWLSQHVPPRVHNSNIRLHCNAWHTLARYQEKGACVFCGEVNSEDRLEHYFECTSLMPIFPTKFQRRASADIPVKYWFLLHLKKPDKIVMSLYVHAIYTLRNMYRHMSSRRELRLSAERIVLDIPLRPALAKYVSGMVLPEQVDVATVYSGPSL